MKIADAIASHMTLSFEVFPPKLDQPLEPLHTTLDHLYALEPDYISCTYGAGGSNKGRNLEICHSIQQSRTTVPLTHFTCIGQTRDDVRRGVQEYVDMGLNNILALRGDLPDGWKDTHGAFQHADGLIGYLKERFRGLCIAAACYPEKHICSDNLEQDIAYMRNKEDAGADFFVTQMCHDVDAYARFLESVRKAGVTKPIVLGLMPILNKDGIVRMTLSNGCSIPAELAAIIGKYGACPDDFRKAGREYTVRQIHRYMTAGVDGLHLYTLNRYADITEIVHSAGLRPAK